MTERGYPEAACLRKRRRHPKSEPRYPEAVRSQRLSQWPLPPPQVRVTLPESETAPKPEAADVRPPKSEPRYPEAARHQTNQPTNPTNSSY